MPISTEAEYNRKAQNRLAQRRHRKQTKERLERLEAWESAIESLGEEHGMVLDPNATFPSPRQSAEGDHAVSIGDSLAQWDSSHSFDSQSYPWAAAPPSTSTATTPLEYSISQQQVSAPIAAMHAGTVTPSSLQTSLTQSTVASTRHWGGENAWLLDPGNSAIPTPAQNNRSTTALHHAAGQGHVEVCKALLTHFSRTSSDRQYPSPSSSASSSSSCSIAERESGYAQPFNQAIVDASDLNGRTPLHYAARSHRLVVVRYLLNNGAQVNIRDSDGLTALHMAAQSGHIDIVKTLLEWGADLMSF